MLERLGFKHFAYDWRPKDIPTFDAEIVALQKHKIDLMAWTFYGDPTHDPVAQATLEIFKRHQVHPQLWVWAGGAPTKTPEEQEQRVQQQADWIKSIVDLAAPYGCKVELYNHNNWFGVEENELAIIDRLKELGVTDVGMVYNFSHAHDALHNDTTHFPELWKKMQPHVVAVNVTGLGPWNQIIYLTQGDHELDMMRTIQESGWTGPVGLIAEKGGDAEVTLRNYMIGLDWLAAELKQPGSGGPRPFSSAKQ